MLQYAFSYILKSEKKTLHRNISDEYHTLPDFAEDSLSYLFDSAVELLTGFS